MQVPKERALTAILKIGAFAESEYGKVHWLLYGHRVL